MPVTSAPDGVAAEPSPLRITVELVLARQNTSSLLVQNNTHEQQTTENSDSSKQEGLKYLGDKNEGAWRRGEEGEEAAE